MNNYVLKQLIIVSFSSILLACAASNESVESMAYESQPVGRDCISQSSIRDYQVLDDSNLIVSAGGKRKYHVELRHRAFGLRSTWKLGFRSPMSRICANNSELVYNDGIRVEQISIASVRLLDEGMLDELLIRFGKKEPEFEQTLAAEDIEGAEVEGLD